MQTFPDKFTLTREQSVFLAKKKWDENVYCGMKMEDTRRDISRRPKTILERRERPGRHSSTTFRRF